MNIQKICIIGDGLAGLSAATILCQQNIRIDLYIGENKKKNFRNNSRTTAISERNYQFFKQKLNIKNNSLFWPCKEINLFHEAKKNIKNFLNFKEKKKNLMYIFQNKKLKIQLEKSITKKKNIRLIRKNIKNINYEDGSILSNNKKCYYDLIILSTGSRSKLNNKISQGRSIKKNYKELALTTIVKHNSKIDKASQFFLKEGPLAILPFSKNAFSVVWSVSSSFFKNNRFLRNILIIKIKDLLGNLKIKNVEKIESFPIRLDLKTRYFKNNILILGEGLHSVHPMAGQGFNLVLRDIKKLSELISKSFKLGLLFKNSSLLKDFSASRKPENIILGLGINLTNLFFKDNKYFLPMREAILKNISDSELVKKICKNISDRGIAF
jgi:2-polyprenyl-6-methoxyphenol hydroxylase-like FAD-dependent oxidoreductase